jgi:hypothetical protein
VAIFEPLAVANVTVLLTPKFELKVNFEVVTLPETDIPPPHPMLAPK